MRFILFFLLLCSPIFSQDQYTVASVPNEHLLDANVFVTNPNGIISKEAEQAINQMIAAVTDSSSAEIAVVLLNSIGNEDIDDFGTELFQSWGLGKKGNDNGLLFLLVYDQREMIFRTGYGLEGVLPDVFLARIIRNDISPELKTGDFDAGIVAGMSKVCQYLLDPLAVEEIMAKEATEKTADRNRTIGIYLFVSLLVFIFFIYSISSLLRSPTTNYAKYLSMQKWQGPVVIASIIFPALMLLFSIFFFTKKKKMRNSPIDCPSCKAKMRKTSGSEELSLLTKAQQSEEGVKSIDYDVWLCDACGNKKILPYSRGSKYSECQKCHAKTRFLQGNMMKSPATSFSSGMGEKVFACKNCSFIEKDRYIIPRIVASSNRGGGGGRRGGGGSWGGGSTGGGGARGGW